MPYYRRYLIAVVLIVNVCGVSCAPGEFAIARRHSSPYPYAWRWWIAHSVLWIVKGGFWLTIFILVLLYKSFPKRHGDCCSPIIVHDPVTFDHHHSSIGGWGRKDDASLAPTDWQLYWRDKMLHIEQNIRGSL